MSAIKTIIGAQRRAQNVGHLPTSDIPYSNVQDAIKSVKDDLTAGLAEMLGDGTSVMRWGATGTGVDDTDAFLAAHDYIESLPTSARVPIIHVPSGVFRVRAGEIVASKPFVLKGPSSGAAVIFSEDNGPFYTIDASAGDLTGGEILDIGFASYNAGTRNAAENAIKIIGSGTLVGWRFRGLRSAGVYHMFDCSEHTGPASGACTFSDIKTTHNGANQTQKCIYSPLGSFGGDSVYSNMTIGYNDVAFEWGDGSTFGPGGMTFDTIQFFGNGVSSTAFKLRGKPGVYGTNWMWNNINFDGGTVRAFDFEHINSFVARNITWNNQQANNLLVSCFDYVIEGSGGYDPTGESKTSTLKVFGTLDYDTTGQSIEAFNAKNGLAAGATTGLWSVDLSNSSGAAVVVEVTTGGYQEGAGPGCVVTRYQLWRNGGGPAVNLLTNEPLNVALAHSVSVASNVVTINAVSTSALPNSRLISRIRVFGQFAQVTKL